MLLHPFRFVWMKIESSDSDNEIVDNQASDQKSGTSNS
jgi:hypothetical protein